MEIIQEIDNTYQIKLLKTGRFLAQPTAESINSSTSKLGRDHQLL